MKNTPTAGRRRRQLIVLILLFSAPPLLALGLYAGGWRPAPKARGDLVMPARPIADAELRTLDGKVTRFSSLKGKWSLVYFGPAECGKDCQRALWILRQVHTAQHKNMTRVQRVFIVLNDRGIERLPAAIREYQPLVVLRGRHSAIDRLAGEFAVDGRPRPAGEVRIYVVDPLGNLVLHYGPDMPPGNINKDMYRLLRVSRVG